MKQHEHRKALWQASLGTFGEGEQTGLTVEGFHQGKSWWQCTARGKNKAMSSLSDSGITELCYIAFVTVTIWQLCDYSINVCLPPWSVRSNEHRHCVSFSSALYPQHWLMAYYITDVQYTFWKLTGGWMEGWMVSGWGGTLWINVSNNCELEFLVWFFFMVSFFAHQ